MRVSAGLSAKALGGAGRDVSFPPVGWESSIHPCLFGLREASALTCISVFPVACACSPTPCLLLPSSEPAAHCVAGPSPWPFLPPCSPHSWLSSSPNSSAALGPICLVGCCAVSPVLESEPQLPCGCTSELDLILNWG